MMTTTCTYQCKFEVAFLAKIIAPTVPDNPVPTWDIDTNDIDVMADGVICSTAGVDAAHVGMQATRVNVGGTPVVALG